MLAAVVARQVAPMSGDFSPQTRPVSARSVSRREALMGGLCLCCLPRPGGAAPPALTEVGPGIFVRTGPHEEATPANAGGIANIGCIVGNRSVLVTDCGGSFADGAWLRAEIVRR